ncbi:uncharacterized protein LOC113333873 isoform X2 [Papaver somniferum]|uniref:uncharacterized protein LOC113333873 isoform X2 n=1 Tax=Papaver somniferum TaxID=3469 RepID=UPI000E6F7939|nr:uncharacterized protein LOC113333873 isoform X2 [Papaver somniferum]
MDVSDLVETTPTSNVTDSQLPSPATGGTKKRKLTSIVWKGFEQIEEVDPDDPQKIKRLKLAQCKICDRKFSGDPKAGTSHLKRHMDSCLKKNQSADETQTLIAPIGSVQRIKVMLPDLPSKGDLFHSVLQKQEETISDDEDDSFWQSRSQNRRDPLSSASEELTRYFAYPEPATFEDMKNFDILGWWKANEKRYPVLSCIARDVLAVPVSTVASESAFSLGKRVLSDYRSSLTPQMLECCVFLKDWWKAELKNRMMTLDPLNDDITPVDDENDVSESSCVSLR